MYTDKPPQGKHSTKEFVLVMSQLELDSSSSVEVGQSSSLFCASQSIHPTVVRLGGLLFHTKRCPTIWFGHVPSKLKSGKDNSRYIRGREWVVVSMRTLFVLLEGFYSAEENVIVVVDPPFCPTSTCLITCLFGTLQQFSSASLLLM